VIFETCKMTAAVLNRLPDKYVELLYRGA